MNEGLSNLSKADGVLGVVVLDQHGQCLVNQLPSPYEPILMSEVAKRLSAAFDVFTSMEEGKVTSFAVDCEDGCIVLRRVDDNWIIALTHPDANMNLVNVAMNVAALNMSRIQPGSGMRPAARSASDSFVGASSRGHSLSSPETNVEIPPDAVDRAVVQQLLVIYREYLGPAAKAVFKQQLAALGVTSRTLRRAQLGDFIGRLSAKILERYRWPGNVRELRNLIEHCSAIAKGPAVLPEDLPAHLRATSVSSSGTFAAVRPHASDEPYDLLPLQIVEQRHIARVLRAVGGNKARAARLLGLSRHQLYLKLSRLREDEVGSPAADLPARRTRAL